jgi:O-antigen/teichoic acid export membrane protein
LESPLKAIAARIKERNPLPEGTLSVAVGIALNGILAYLFLALPKKTGRLDAAQYKGLTTLWLLTFLVAPGFFMPIEQEVGRALSARLVRKVGGRPVVKRAAILGAVIAAALVIVSLASSSFLLKRAFNHEGLLLAGFVMSLVGYAILHLTRGVLSGTRKFLNYGFLMAGEGAVRLIATVVLIIIGTKAAGPYGLCVGIAPLIAVAISLSRSRPELLPGPEAEWAEISVALGWLVLSQVLAQVLVNGAPLAVSLLAKGKAQNAKAGNYAAAYILARVPLFMFQAVQAALLPKLAALATAGQHQSFKSGLRKLLLMVAGVAVVATVVGGGLGPSILPIIFGKDSQLNHLNFAMLALGASAFMAATTLGQALIALQAYGRAACGWAAGVAVFFGSLFVSHDLLFRASVAFVIGSVASTAVMWVLLSSRLSSGDVPDDDTALLEALSRSDADGV